jgi:hypothetical protein
MASGLEFGMVSESPLVQSEMVWGMVLEIVLELEKASGKPSQSKLIGHVCINEIHVVCLAPLLLCLLFFV